MLGGSFGNRSRSEEAQSESQEAWACSQIEAYSQKMPRKRAATGNQRRTSGGTRIGAGFPIPIKGNLGSTRVRKRRAIQFLRKAGFVIIRRPYAWLQCIEPHLCPPVEWKRARRWSKSTLCHSKNCE